MRTKFKAPKSLIKKLVKGYKRGHSLAKLAKSIRRSLTLVRRLLTEAKVKIRSRGQPMKKKK